MRRHWLRFFPGAIGRFLLGLAWLATSGAATRAQDAPVDSDSPARFVPADGLTLYVEFAGLDAHEAAWRKSAACKILNDTPTGAMLEDLFIQIYGRYNPGGMSGADVLKLIKHVARSGVAVGVSVAGQDRASFRGTTVMVFRKAFANKEVRPLFARYLQTLPAPGTKAESRVVAGHKLVAGKHGAETFAWWVEETKKEDLIVVSGTPGADAVALETLDGKTPSALAHPARAELMKANAGLEPVGLALLDPQAMKAVDVQGGMVRFFRELGASRVDMALGFRGEAIEATTSLRMAPADGKTVLLRTVGKILGAGFARDSLPAVPAGVNALVALGYDAKNLLATFPGAREQLDRVAAQTTPRLKIRWQEDLFAHLGPKLTAYILPGKAGGTGASLPGALSMIPGLGGGADALPKAAILVDVDNPTALGKTLDELMGFANRGLKGAMAPPRGLGGEGTPPPPPPGGPRGRGGPPAPPAPEFRLMGGDTKTYVLNVPPELASMIPAGFRPTIRLGPKQLAVATSADVARQALDAKGNYAPPAEIADDYGRLPGRLNWLMVADPRASTPEVLASLPGKLQAALNTINPPSPAAPPAGSPAPGSPGAPAAAPGPVVLNVDSSKIPAADDVRKLLFPAIHTVATEGDIIRITSRIAFPAIPDPAAFAVGFKAGQAMTGARAAGAATPPGREVQDGFFDVPARDPGERPSTGPPPAEPPPAGRRKGPPVMGGAGGVQRPN